MMNLINALVIALGVTQFLDWSTTRTILKNGGHEQNPVIKKAMEIFGVDIFLVAKGIAVTAVGTYIGGESIWFLAVIVTFYVWVIIHNWKSMP